jgi:hypothetical protein
MRGDSLEFPYCRFFCLVVLDMVEDLIVCDDLFRLIVVNGAKELDPGGIVFYLPIMIRAQCRCPSSIGSIRNVLPTRSLG